MKTALKISLVALLGVAGVTLSTASAQSPVVMRITGGSVGRYVDTSHSLTTSGHTEFSANIQVRQDGTATGEFTCALAGVVVIAGQAGTATVNADSSVTINGTGYGYFVGLGGFDEDTFFVTFRAGGVDVGGFDFADANFPVGVYDTEVVKDGSIKIVNAP